MKKKHCLLLFIASIFFISPFGKLAVAQDEDKVYVTLRTFCEGEERVRIKCCFYSGEQLLVELQSPVVNIFFTQNITKIKFYDQPVLFNDSFIDEIIVDYQLGNSYSLDVDIPIQEETIEYSYPESTYPVSGFIEAVITNEDYSVGLGSSNYSKSQYASYPEIYKSAQGTVKRCVDIGSHLFSTDVSWEITATNLDTYYTIMIVGYLPDYTGYRNRYMIIPFNFPLTRMRTIKVIGNVDFGMGPWEDQYQSATLHVCRGGLGGFSFPLNETYYLSDEDRESNADELHFHVSRLFFKNIAPNETVTFGGGSLGK